MKVALYARVSRADIQTTANQFQELRAWASRLGGEVVAEYTDKVSGTKQGNDRPGLQRMLDAAHRRDFDVLLVWSLDRLTRNGVVALVGILDRLKTAGVGLKSLRESWLDSSNPLVAELLVSIFGWVAKSEREQLIARTKAGMARAKRGGVRLGRPRVGVDAEQAQRAMAKAGSIRGAARLLKVDESLLRRRLAEA